MQDQQEFTYHLGDIAAAAEFVLSKAGSRRVIALYGGMGAGKTTLVKAICARLGIQDVAASPSFALINVYAHPDGEAQVYHIDLYRLRHLEEALDIGVEEILYSSKDYVFIEWPEILEPLLPEDTLRAHLENLGGDQRRISI